ncbi:OmpW/AlkL family protein [Acidimangrovimonas sediminis]|uniref:OmpW/AlkL family protein n=1 Tax=Acidimangrovimonas sediminis TaxID=2056283 RepID=UPI000C803078
MTTALSALALAAFALPLAAPVQAQPQGAITFGLGLGDVAPKSDNGTLLGAPVTVDNNIQPTFTLEYFVRNNLGIELLAATPFKHNVNLAGTKIGTVKHLPPTLTLNYYFDTGSKFTPFLGAGVNYTFIYSEKTPVAGLNIKNTMGIALHAGVDYAIDDRNAIRADLRYIRIKPDVEVNGTKIGSLDLSPMVYGISWVHRF